MSVATTISEEPLSPVSAREPAREGAALRSFAVRVRGLVKHYSDGTQANCGIDLDVRRGEVMAILGPNGAGKTTFLRQLTTELRPTSGAIKIFDIDAIAQPERAKRLMGITPQEAGLFETLTVREHLELFARLKGLSKREAWQQTDEIVVELGLVAEKGKRVGKLSGGQRRRILIGLALLGTPPLLVLDEPTTGLDPASRQEVWRSIRVAVSQGATIILSTHYMEEAEALSDRIGIISAGQLIALGSLNELFGRLDKSYRLSYRDPLDPFNEPAVHFFATFAAAQAHVAHEQLSEYSIARASLEDVYFTLTGTRFADNEREGNA